MKVKTNYFLLGLFVIAGTAAVVAGILTVGATTFASRGLVVETYFAESVQGLEKGAIVRFRGVRLGVVTEIRLVTQLYKTDMAYAAVRCLIDPTDAGLTNDEMRQRLADRVREGYRVRLGSQGLTGALYLETDLVNDPRLLEDDLRIDWTPANPYVPSVPSRIARIGNSVEEVLTSLSRTDFPGLVQDARTTLESMREAARVLDPQAFRTDVAGVAESARTALDDAKDRIDRVADRLDALLDDTRRVVGAVDPETLRRTLDGLAAFADALPATRERIDAALESARGASEELRGELRTKGRDAGLILAELRRAATHLAGLADTLERYPSLLLIGNPPPRTEPGK